MCCACLLLFLGLWVDFEDACLAGLFSLQFDETIVAGSGVLTVSMLTSNTNYSVGRCRPHSCFQ